jgi:hypothetical protein
MERVGRLVETSLRRIALLGQLAHPLVSLLRQDQASLRTIERCLARRDDLGSGAGVDVRKLRVGDKLSGKRLLVLGQGFGLSIRTSTALASTFWPRITGTSPTRPSTRAAMSNRVASTSPCTSRGWPRTRYQIDRVATAAMTTATMRDGMRPEVGARGLGVSDGGSGGGGVARAGAASVRASVIAVSIRIPGRWQDSFNAALPRARPTGANSAARLLAGRAARFSSPRSPA